MEDRKTKFCIIAEISGYLMIFGQFEEMVFRKKHHINVLFSIFIHNDTLHASYIPT